jgi:hypothetical protein
VLSPYASLGRYAGGPTGASPGSLLLPRYPSYPSYANLPPGSGGYQPPNEAAPSFKGFQVPQSILQNPYDGAAGPTPRRQAPAGAAAAPAAAPPG